MPRNYFIMQCAIPKTTRLNQKIAEIQASD